MVTGATGGIGKAIAAGLAKRGDTVVLVARSRERGVAVREEIRAATGNRGVHLVLADLASQAQVRGAAGEIAAGFGRVDVLVNNAAVYTRRRSLTPDRVETQWAVNHLAPFLLTHLLLDSLGSPARVVNLSSNAHRGAKLRWDDLQMERRYSGVGMYARTKLANLLFTRELARRAADAGVTANAMHPGVVATDLLLNGFPPLKLVRRFLRTPEQGAKTAVWLASSPGVEGVTGKYFADEKEIEPSREAQDDEAARRLWQVSEEMTGLGG